MRAGTAGLLAAALTMLAVVPSRHAEARWPERPVRLLIPAPPGGALDSLSRVLAEKLAPGLGQPVLPDFRPGGSGTIAADALLRAAPDGHTLLVAPNGLLTDVPHTLELRFDPHKDLRALAELARSTLVLVGNPKNAPADLAQLIAEVRAKPGTTSYASYSPGSISHFAGLMLNRLAGLDMLHVGYKGSPPALADVMGGQVTLMFDALITSAPLVRAGRLKAYAVSSPQRTEFLPAVPTFRELGYPDLAFTGWIGVFGPQRLPPELATRIRMEFLVALASPQVRERLRQLSFDQSPPSTPEELERALRADYARTAILVKAFGIGPDKRL